MKRSILSVRLLLMAPLLWQGSSWLCSEALAGEPAKSEKATMRAASISREPLARVLGQRDAQVFRLAVPEGKLQSRASGLQDWQDILSENFEALFPQANNWYTDHSPGFAPYFWGKDDYRPHFGAYSAWCAGDHDPGFPNLDPATAEYPDDMSAWMIWGPFSLSDATDAELLFYYWLDSESGYDFVSWMASIDGANFYGWSGSGNSGGWMAGQLDLTEVYILGDLTGQEQVWIAFIFESDGSIGDVGAFVDDIVLRKKVIDLPPSIEHTPVSTASEGIDMPVVATITDDGGVTGANLHYRRGGESSFTTVILTATRADYSGAIPGSDVTDRGVEYYLSASDGINTSYDPPENYLTSPHVTRVQVQNLVKAEPQPGGSDQTAYRMISVPLEMDDPDIDSVLEDDLGAYDDTQWRLLRYAEGDYLEHDYAGDFDPGEAFWLIVKEANKTIDAGSGTTVTTADSFAITLNPGWNDIGLPFDFPVSWNQISVDTSRINGPYAYNGQWLLPSSVTYLSPWEGYAIKNLSESDIVLKIPPIFGMGASGAELPFFPLAKLQDVQWFIRLSAQCEQARDGINYLGCSPAALQDRDVLDLSEPPPIGSYVSLYFPHLDWGRYPDRLTTDFRPPIGQGDGWDFVVESNIPNSTVRLSWDEVESVPFSLQAYLLDKVEGVALNLRTQQSYGFASGGRREFLLAVGTREYQSRQTQLSLPKEYMLCQNFPNPFNPLTRISFHLPIRTEFKLTLYNVLGEKIKTIAQGTCPAGVHQISLDAKDLAAGVYFYKFEAGQFMDVKKMVVLK